jgi:hypothetical protein
VRIRAIRPEVQCERLFALFAGARVPHPAAALAAWKRATAPRGGLGRPLEAAIAALNPEMAGELRLLDRAEVVMAFDGDAGPPTWYAAIPRDDGTFAALATALTLTGGGSDPPLGPLPVDRLGPPGAPLVVRTPEALLVAGSRAGLDRARGEDRTRVDGDDEGIASGWVLQLDPAGLGRSGPLARRRAAEALRALGCRRVEASGGLEGETLALRVRWHGTPPDGIGHGAIDPAWLDGLPEARVMAALAWAIDPSPAAWELAFALADRIERADPARAGVAPLRTRLNLAAAAVKVRPEVDLWPQLRGLSGAVLADPAGTGAIDGAVVGLHAASPGAAERIARVVLPALAPLLGLHPEPAAPPAASRRLGNLRGRPLDLSQRGASVWLVWGEVEVQPGRSLGPGLRALSPWGDRPPQRLAALWPGRLNLAPTLGEPLARTLAESPPVVWWGHDDAPSAHDVLRWSGLRDLVRRFLDRIPLDPPPTE